MYNNLVKLIHRHKLNHCLNNNGLNLLKLCERCVTYKTLESGEKVVVNVKDSVKTEREKWQNVRPMGYEEELLQIKAIELNERLESDPKVARRTATAKLQSLKDTLLQRGFCRETKAYKPPENVKNIIENICGKVFANNVKRDVWDRTLLSDSFVKYKFLTECSKSMGYEVPNSVLYRLKTVENVFNFYSTPVRGVTSYDEMALNADQLPQNLHVIPEPIRYNPENDQFFGGINAYPFTGLKVRGLRAQKKYKSFSGHFEWPDV